MEKIDNLKDIKLFIDACDNMLESKFILVDKRIGDVLKSIAKTKQVYNLMATCLVGFNFEKEWKMACSKGKELNLPIDQSKSTAFVFCLLNAIDDKKININDILQKHFSCDDCISAYKLFCQKIVLPFKVNVVNALYEKPERQVVEETEQDVPVKDDEIIKRLIFLIKDLKAYVNGLKKIKNGVLTKDEIMFMLNHFIELCENKNTYSLAALVLGVRAGFGTDKELQRRLKEVEDIIKGLN